MDVIYFKYIISKNNCNSEKLAKILGVSRRQVDRKIKNSQFTLLEIYKLLEALNLKFYDLFKKEEE